MKKELVKKIERILKRYHKEMQRNMQRFANEIIELKFEEEEKDDD